MEGQVLRRAACGQIWTYAPRMVVHSSGPKLEPVFWKSNTVFVFLNVPAQLGESPSLSASF
jgi:hypothetical protein